MCIRRSGKKLRDDLSTELRKLFVSAGVIVRKFVIIESHQVKEGYVNIADVMYAIHGLGANLIGRANGVAGFGTAPGKPHGHRFGIVIAAIGCVPSP